MVSIHCLEKLKNNSPANLSADSRQMASRQAADSRQTNDQQMANCSPELAVVFLSLWYRLFVAAVRKRKSVIFINPFYSSFFRNDNEDGGDQQSQVMTGLVMLLLICPNWRVEFLLYHQYQEAFKVPSHRSSFANCTLTHTRHGLKISFQLAFWSAMGTEAIRKLLKSFKKLMKSLNANSGVSLTIIQA